MTFPLESPYILPCYCIPKNNDLFPESSCILPYYYTSWRVYWLKAAVFSRILLQKRAYYLRNDLRLSICLSEYVIVAHVGRNFPENWQ